MVKTIRFLLGGEVVSVTAVDPTRTVLQYLREDRRRLGTKEGCAEGDCGACTVVVAQLNAQGDGLVYQAINSCIQFLPTLDGKALLTVESLAARGASAHPVQRAMVECHASQCGFCTPGFVMSLFATYKTQPRPTRTEVDIALAGNLCRCTGYRPIVDAAQTMYDYADALPAADMNWLTQPYGGSDDDGSEARVVEQLCALRRQQTLELDAAGTHYYAPTNLAQFADLVARHPDACILAGGTDVGLWVTKQYQRLSTVIFAAGVEELLRIEHDDAHIQIGAAVSISDAMPVLLDAWPDLRELLLRFASPPIRNAATLGGNIANGSPIGDSMPVLMAIETRLVLRCGDETRELPLDEFYLDYQRTALAPGEFVECIIIPKPVDGQIVRTYKLSKRFDQDISAVCAAFALQLDGDRVARVRVAYGGVAATVKRATLCEEILQDAVWDQDSVSAGMRALDRDFTPIGDMRASAVYRRTTTRNLLQRFFLDSRSDGRDVNVYNYAR